MYFQSWLCNFLDFYAYICLVLQCCKCALLDRYIYHRYFDETKLGDHHFRIEVHICCCKKSNPHLPREAVVAGGPTVAGKPADYCQQHSNNPSTIFLFMSPPFIPIYSENTLPEFYPPQFEQ